MFWKSGKACQKQSDDAMDSVCTRNSTYVRWGSTSLVTPAGETCSYKVRGGRRAAADPSSCERSCGFECSCLRCVRGSGCGRGIGFVCGMPRHAAQRCVAASCRACMAAAEVGSRIAT